MYVCMSAYKVMLNGGSSDGTIWHKCSLTIQKFNQAGVLEIDQPFGLDGPKCAGRWKKMIRIIKYVKAIGGWVKLIFGVINDFKLYYGASSRESNAFYGIEKSLFVFKIF